LFSEATAIKADKKSKATAHAKSYQKSDESLGSAKILGNFRQQPDGRTSVVTNMKAASTREKTGIQRRPPSGVLIEVII